MLRVAHVISTPEGRGGAEQVVGALVKAGAERGHEQLLLNPFGRQGSGSMVAEGLPLDGFETFACEHLSGLPALRSWLRDRLRSFSPDVVNVHLFHAQVAVASLRRDSGEKRILTHHHGRAMRVQGRPRFLQLMDRISVPRYDRVVAVSEDVSRFLTTQYRYDAGKIVTIPNGWARVEAHRPPKDPGRSIVCVANFNVHKDHATLIRALDEVVRQIDDAHLFLVGDGELLPDVKRQVEGSGLSAHVTFTGAVSDVWPFLDRAHVFCLPSTYESLGIAVLEAMAAGLPVVATRVGGIPELVDEGVTGILVGAGDHLALAKGLTTVLTRDDLRSGMGAAGRRAASALTAGVMADRYLALYESLTSEAS